MTSPVYTIDVAHPPRHPGVVEHELDEGMRMVKGSSRYRILKVVHGYGSSGRGGATREVVLNWCFARRSRLRASIPGENFSLFNAVCRDMRNEVGAFPDADLDAANRGITIIWVK